MRCLVTVLLLLIAGFATLAAPADAASTPNYLNLAKNGLSKAHKWFWNPQAGFWNDDLSPHRHASTPLATIWSAVGLFEALDGVALAEPTTANKKAVADFAKYADTRYWNGQLLRYGGWSAYPGDHGVSNCVYFDDDSWWGIGFLDAYRATGNRRFLRDAKRTSNFIDARAWVGGRVPRGMKWNSWVGNPCRFQKSYALEALSSAAALAAGIYESSGDKRSRLRAERYIAWADSYAFDRRRGVYDTIFRLPQKKGGQKALSYVHATMTAAHLSLCRGWHGKGDAAACGKLRALGRAAYDKWNGDGETYFSPRASIFFRYIIQLAAYKHDPKLWDWASSIARKALRHSKAVHGLYLKCWNGRSPRDARCGQHDLKYGQIKGHGATVALFAWLAAFRRPAGPGGVSAVRADPEKYESDPVAAPGYFAWSEDGNLLVQAGNHAPVRVNPAGTVASAGGISGHSLVYTQWSESANKDIYLYDLRTKARTKLTDSDASEFAPTISGDLVLFTRDSRHCCSGAGSEDLVLLDLEHHRTKTLYTAPSGSNVMSGQINGNFAVWQQWDAARPKNDSLILEHDLTKHRTTMVSGGRSSAAAVSADGTVYWVEGVCPSEIRKSRRAGGGRSRGVALRPGLLGDKLYVLDTTMVLPTVFFTQLRSRCPLVGPSGADIFKVIG